jgi:hypothetical protein
MERRGGCPPRGKGQAMTEELKPPGGLKPAQLGVVLLGRVIASHAAATLTDLAVRGIIRVTPSGEAGDWELARVPARKRASLAPFEEALAGPLLSTSAPVLLSGLDGRLPDALDRFRASVIKDAVHRGWLRRIGHERTPAGDELGGQARAFRGRLRHLKASGPAVAIADYLPYAIVFGLAADEDLPLAGFAAAWGQACSALPGWRHEPTPRREQPIPNASTLSDTTYGWAAFNNGPF